MVILVLFALIAGASAQSAWLARSDLPVRITKDNFTGVCIVNAANLTDTIAFQWANGSSISPKANMYAISVEPLNNRALRDPLVLGNLSVNYTWTVLPAVNTTWASSPDMITWVAKITIINIRKDEVGDLLCANTTAITVSAYPFVFMAGSTFSKKNVIQSDDFRLSCEAYGWPVPKVIGWYKNEDMLFPSERVQFVSSNKTINSTVHFRPIEFDDEAEYSCYASNVHGVSDNSTLALFVKDRWAALWPFLGIVAEVIVLCTAILLYERRQQAKLAAEEEEENEKGENAALNDTTVNADDHAVGNGDDVRQRPIVKS